MGGWKDHLHTYARTHLHTFFALLLLAACAPAPRASTYEGVALSGAAPEFALVDHLGREVILADLRGQVVVAAFLDSRCVEVCPRTAEDLRRVYRALGERAEAVAFVGINVNPQANTLEDVRGATDAWGLEEIAGWRFLTGEAKALETVWAAYHIGVVPAAGVGQLEHTAGVYIIDPAGQWRWYVSMPDDGSNAYPEFQPVADLLLAHVQALLENPG